FDNTFEISNFYGALDVDNAADNGGRHKDIRSNFRLRCEISTTFNISESY
ncbi:MAG: hypothetical protein ACI8W7_004167, partial [Gammaproteobacteria bacterium]